MNKIVKKEWWLLVCAIFYFSCVSFIYLGKKCNNKLWMTFGVIYLVLLGGLFGLDDQFRDAGWFKSVLAVYWLCGICHTYFTLDSYWKIKKEIDQNNDKTNLLSNEISYNNQIKEHFEGRTLQETVPSANTEIEPDKKFLAGAKVIDINSCKESDLVSLPGVSIVLAKRALNYRKEHDGFSSVEEFYDIMQLKPHFVAQIQGLVECKPIDNHVSPKDNSTGRKLDL